jgi:hypothetical protein
MSADICIMCILWDIWSGFIAALGLFAQSKAFWPISISLAIWLSAATVASINSRHIKEG